MSTSGTVRTVVDLLLVVAVVGTAAGVAGLSCSETGAREPQSSTTGPPAPAESPAGTETPGAAAIPTTLDTSPTAEARTLALPAPRGEGPMSLEAAIQARRSVREFTEEPLTLDEVGQLLWATQGITSPQGARAAPSAGGTYPLEIYVAAGRVTGLDPGLYRYRPAGHELALVAPGDVRTLLAEAALDQTWVAQGAMDVVIAAVYARTTERYGERGIRYVHLEAGHAAENLCLQAAALGLGAVTVGAFSDAELAAAAQLSDDQTPLYVIPVGRPASP